MAVPGWMILAPVGLLFAFCAWRFLLGLTAPDILETDILENGDIPIRVTRGTVIWAAMTIFTGLLFAICLV